MGKSAKVLKVGSNKRNQRRKPISNRHASPGGLSSTKPPVDIRAELLAEFEKLRGDPGFLSWLESLLPSERLLQRKDLPTILDKISKAGLRLGKTMRIPEVPLPVREDMTRCLERLQFEIGFLQHLSLGLEGPATRGQAPVLGPYAWMGALLPYLAGMGGAPKVVQSWVSRWVRMKFPGIASPSKLWKKSVLKRVKERRHVNYSLDRFLLYAATEFVRYSVMKTHVANLPSPDQKPIVSPQTLLFRLLRRPWSRRQEAHLAAAVRLMPFLRGRIRSAKCVAQLPVPGAAVVEGEVVAGANPGVDTAALDVAKGLGIHGQGFSSDFSVHTSRPATGRPDVRIPENATFALEAARAGLLPGRELFTFDILERLSIPAPLDPGGVAVIDRNVGVSDVCVYVSASGISARGILMQRLCSEARKPFLLMPFQTSGTKRMVAGLVRFLLRHKPRVIYLTGTLDADVPGISVESQTFLRMALLHYFIQSPGENSWRRGLPHSS